MPKLTIEIWSDIACPWCWVGKRHLENAAARFEHEVQLIWRAFELDPNAPKELVDVEAVDYVERLARKYGTSRAGAQQMIDRMTERGAEIGLEFRFDRARAANTFDAHRLLHLAAKQGLQNALQERLFVAYMNEGQLISDHETLVALVEEVGLDPDEARRVLQSDIYAREVRTEEAAAHQIGVTGVPFFVMAGRLAIPGAQPPERLLEAMNRAWDESAQGQPSASGELCGPDGCLLPRPGG